MKSFLAHAAKIGIRQAIQASAVSVVYDPDGLAISIDKAGFGDMVIEAEGVDSEPVRVNNDDSRDLIVWPADLVDGQGDQVEPEQGTEVQVTLPDDSVVSFSIAAQPPDPCWRWTDRYQTARRIHMERIEAA